MTRYLPFSIFVAALLLITGYAYSRGVGPIYGDDIWAATSVMGSIVDTIVFTLRFDLHPPLYYVLLNIWAFVSQSDSWLRLSSSVIHALLTTSVFIIARRRSGTTAAAVSAILVFLCPALVSYTSNLRMYELIALLSVWLFYYVEKSETGRALDKKSLKIIFILELMLVYTHAIGILFVFFHFLYGLSFNYRISKKELYKWVLLHGCIFLLSTPVLLNSLVKSADHAAIPSFINMLEVYAPVLLPKLPSVLLNIVVGFGLASVLCFNSRNRQILIFYVVAPAVVYCLVSVLIKPLWLGRNFIFAFPVILIAFSQQLSVWAGYQKKLFWLLFASFICCSVGLQFTYKKPAVNPIEKELISINNQKSVDEPVCIVVADSIDKYWSLLRYVIGPDWGNPLESQPKPSEKWVGILSRVPVGLADALKLIPQQYYVTNNMVTVTADAAAGCDHVSRSNFIFISK